MERIESILIVGGGTAGWMAASYLDRALNRTSSLPVSIKLVEASEIPTVGVGESTLPSLKLFLDAVGVGEREWMAECEASFKLAVRFVGWNDGSLEDEFWHPFGTWERSRYLRVPLSHAWLAARAGGWDRSFASSIFHSVHLCRAGRAPKADPDRGEGVTYGYHVDAGLFAGYLKRRCIARGVRHVVDQVVDVPLDEHGSIDRVVVRQHGDLRADLYVDCSGFAGLLIQRALGEPFVSYGDSLPCDRAVAIRAPYTAGEDPIEPFTTATALPAGWAWNVPLLRREGCGYVYGSAFVSDDDAERQLRQHLGAQGDGAETWGLRMRVGRSRSAWVKNCVSIGLSSGFIEPLEATSIHLIELGLERLVQCFPDRRFDPAVIRHYNASMRAYYEEIRDFIVLHYCLAGRDDSAFWRASRNDLVLPESLREKLELWRSMLPFDSRPIGEIFPHYSYICILAGLGRLPDRPTPLLAGRDGAAWIALFQAIEEQSKRLVHRLPDLRRYLESLRSPEEGDSRGTSTKANRVRERLIATLHVPREYRALSNG